MIEPSVEVSERPKPENPYTHSKASEILIKRRAEGKTPRVAFVDIDSTLTGSPDIQAKIRKRFEELGCVLVYISSRTYEMMMSRQKFNSAQLPYKRRAPQLNTSSDFTIIDQMRDEKTTFVEGFPDEVESFEGLFDPHIIAGSTGTEIVIQQEDGYMYDEEFIPNNVDPATWREKALGYLEAVAEASGVQPSFAQIESAESYTEGRADVYPPDFRIQLNFPSLQAQLAFERAHTNDAIRFIEDGKPKKGLYQIYVAPAHTGKDYAADHILDNLLEVCRNKNAQLQREDIEVFCIGDSYPDAQMGLLAGKDTELTLFLAGDSRLASLGGEIEDTFASKRLLTMNPDENFKQTDFGYVSETRRKIVVGSKVYPDRTAQESVLDFLNNLED